MRMRSTSVGFCFLLATSAVAHPGSGIVVDKGGRVYFTDTGRGVWKIEKQGSPTLLPASLFHWMAIDEAGRFADAPKSFAGWFERVTAQGAKPALIISSDFPITIGGDGNLYYAETRPRSPRIVRRTADGKESVVAAEDSFVDIAGITLGPADVLYITDARSIRKIAKDGKVSQFAGPEVIATGRDRAVVPPPDADPGYCRGLAVDSDGTVYVAATGSRRVLRITPRGEVSTILQSEGAWSPTGVAIFGGETYVLEWRDAPASQTEERRAWVPRVRKVGRDGKVTTLATIAR